MARAAGDNTFRRDAGSPSAIPSCFSYS